MQGMHFIYIYLHELRPLVITPCAQMTDFTKGSFLRPSFSVNKAKATFALLLSVTHHMTPN